MEAFGGALAACRDVPEWSDAEASAWWRNHPPRARFPGQAPETSEQTLVIASHRGD